VTRLRRIEVSDRFFFVTTNLARDVAPLAIMERNLILARLMDQRQRGDFYLFGYVVMPTHLHLLFYPHNKDLIRIMRDLKSKTGFEIARGRGAHGPIWQERYFDAIIRRVRNFWEKLEYIHRNPVEAGIVKNPEDWEWSSYRHYIKKGDDLITLDPVEFPSDGDHFLWPAPWR
jgi:putative transposase